MMTTINKLTTNEKIVCVSAATNLVALGFIAYSIINPTPYAIVLTMTLGQAIWALAFLSFLVAVARDLYQARLVGTHSIVSDTDEHKLANPSDVKLANPSDVKTA